MNRQLLIISDRKTAFAVRQVFWTFLGVEAEVLLYNGTVKPYGDIWENTYHSTIGLRVAQFWKTNKISAVVIGPLGCREHVPRTHLFTAFLRRYYKCAVPIIGFEPQPKLAGLALPSDTYTPVYGIRVLQLLQSVSSLPPAASFEIGAEAKRNVDRYLREALNHDFRYMEDDADAASEDGDIIGPAEAAQSLILRYHDLRLGSSFLRVDENYAHLLPESYLEGLEGACEQVLSGRSLLSKDWVLRINSYINDFIEIVENWN